MAKLWEYKSLVIFWGFLNLSLEGPKKVLAASVALALDDRPSFFLCDVCFSLEFFKIGFNEIQFDS